MKGWVDFRAVQQAVSLEAVLRRYQVKGLRRRRNQLQGCCPIHGGQRDDSFRASLSKNAFHCFACQAKGNVLDFVAAMERCTIREAALQLHEWMGGSEVARPGAEPAGHRKKGELVREKEACNPPLHFVLRGVDSSHPYLVERGIDRGTAVEFGVGFYGAEGLLRGRIVIPIGNERGEMVAYAGRAVDSTPPKYKLPPGFRRGRELFNLHRAVATGSHTVIVVEGYFDCLRVHQAGFPCVVALMGCSLSSEQESKLVDRFGRVLLLLDGDQAGRAATQAIRARLSENCSVAAVLVPSGSQPDQLSPAAIRQLLETEGAGA